MVLAGVDGSAKYKLSILFLLNTSFRNIFYIIKIDLYLSIPTLLPYFLHSNESYNDRWELPHEVFVLFEKQMPRQMAYSVSCAIDEN